MSSILPDQIEKKWVPAVALRAIRGPLTSIQLSVDSIKSAKVGDDLNVYLDIIHRAAEKINDMLNTILLDQQRSNAYMETD